MIKTLIAANPGGLANRIKCLVSMWRLSERYDLNLYLNWNRNDKCGASFYRLFKNQFKFISNDALEGINYKHVSETYRFIPLPGEIPDNFARVYSTKRGNNIEFAFDRIPVGMRESIISYLNQLQPVKAIESVVTKFTIKHNVPQLVGVHIRRGDFLDGKEGLGKVSSDNKFIEKMNEILKDDPSAGFFLCTDCQITEDKFVKEFGEKIIVYPKKSLDRTSSISTQQSLVDLLLLSKTKHIIGTYCSTFTELAWWFGRCKAKVDMIIDDEIKKQYEIKKQKMENSKYEKFKVFVYNTLCKLRVFKK